MRASPPAASSWRSASSAARSSTIAATSTSCSSTTRKAPPAAAASTTSPPTISSPASPPRSCACSRTHTDRGQAYRVDLRLRPEGHRGSLARSLASTLAYYDTMGRTWERQALIKVRPVAGNMRLGEEFVRTIEPFVYRKYLERRRDQRDQGPQAAHRAEDRPGRRNRQGSQDRARRHPRRRVHDPVLATTQRRRPARGPPAQHAQGPACRSKTSAA